MWKQLDYGIGDTFVSGVQENNFFTWIDFQGQSIEKSH
jgi:hypothetical protein